MTTTCPTCKGSCHTLQSVRARLDGTRYGKLVWQEEMRRCPMCFGTGHVAVAFPDSTPQNIASSDFNLVRQKNWRTMDKHGAIQGLPKWAGRAIATDGILVVIERPQGDRVVGHLDSFVETKPENEKKAKRRSVLDQYVWGAGGWSLP